MGRNALWGVIAVGMIALASCDNGYLDRGGNPGPPPEIKERGEAKTTDEAASHPIAALVPAELEVQVVDAAGYAEVLKKHAGKVVFVDFWATYCAPCLKRFPHSVHLSKKLRDHGLIVISFSVDDTDDLASVKKFLADQHADFPHLITKFGVGTETADAFDVGAVPDFRLYDRQGKLRYHWRDQEISELTNEQLDAKIEELLAEKE